MLGSEGPGPVERWVAAGRLAAALDVIELLRRLPSVAQIVVATSERQAAQAHARLPVDWDFDPPGIPFHFGHRLAGLVERYPAAAHVYLGAGSLPLLPGAVLAEAIGEAIAAGQPLAITNNLYSSDWIVLNCAQAIRQRPDRLPNDNALGWVLKTEAGVAVRALPPSAATRLDIDTPADLLLLSLHPHIGPHLRRFLTSQPHAPTQWLNAGRCLFTPGGQVALVGRVASGVWAHVEAHTQAWVRVFSEERGMSASGRQGAGQVRSLLGVLLEELGHEKFFGQLAQIVQAGFIDTRVLLAHQRRWPSAADRYASDLGLADQVSDPWLRALTAAAAGAGIPLVLGGHGVVAGGLYGLVEIAQSGALNGPGSTGGPQRA
jgi:CTP:molybdopterin cytidylyltransferase MocA